MIDTLEEAIKHCEEVAEELEEEAVKGCCDDSEIMDKCIECANEHRQLAEWLKELKGYEEAEEEINRKMESGQWSDAVAYGMNKALVIMHKHIREVKADEDSD